MCFFAKSGKKGLKSTKITLAVGEMESICFKNKGLSVLSSITNKKIDVRYMAVMDIEGVFEKEEKEETKKKEFVIRERLYMRNTGIFFLECLRNTVFIPVIEIEVDCRTNNWGGFEEAVGIHIETNALVGNISTEIKQMIGKIIAQKETVVENKFGYPKLVFEEDSKHGEQNETGKSEEQPSTEYQELDLEKLIKKYTGDEEQPESEESSEQPSTGCQASDEIFKEFHNLLQRSSDMHNPGERNYSHDKKLVGVLVNLFSEDRS